MSMPVSNAAREHRVLLLVWIVHACVSAVLMTAPWAAYFHYRFLGYSHSQLAAGSTFSNISFWSIMPLAFLLPVSGVVVCVAAALRQQYRAAQLYLALAVVQVVVATLTSMAMLILVG